MRRQVGQVTTLYGYQFEINDHLGSPTLATGESAQVAQSSGQKPAPGQHSFDAWGARRNAKPQMKGKREARGVHFFPLFFYQPDRVRSELDDKNVGRYVGYQTAYPLSLVDRSGHFFGIIFGLFALIWSAIGAVFGRFRGWSEK